MLEPFVKYTIIEHEFFHDGGPYRIETSPLICSANRWTGFCMIGTAVMKELMGWFTHKTKLEICFSLLVVITCRSFIYSKKKEKDWVFKLQIIKKVSRGSLSVIYLMMGQLQSKIPFFLFVTSLSYHGNWR